MSKKKYRPFREKVVCRDTGEQPRDYGKYLLTRHWRKVREKKMKEQGYICERCKKKFKTPQLQIHHLTYENIGNEKMEDLMCLCTNCHNIIHGSKKALEKENKDKEAKYDRMLGLIIKHMNKLNAGERKRVIETLEKKYT